jgi:hypothetical protein
MRRRQRAVVVGTTMSRRQFRQLKEQSRAQKTHQGRELRMMMEGIRVWELRMLPVRLAWRWGLFRRRYELARG